MNPEVTREDVEDLKARVYANIAAEDKAAAGASLYQLSPSVSLFWKQHDNVGDEEIRQMHEMLLDAACKISALEGAMDEYDEYVFADAQDHMRLSFEERGYADLLGRLSKSVPQGAAPVDSTKPGM